MFIYTNCALASERIVTKTIDNMADLVFKKKSEVGAENILVVYDFDNTLMAMNQDIGSDQWFQWQSELIKKGNLKDAIASSKEELLDLNYKIFALGKMHIIEPQAPGLVKEIQNQKIKSIVLTSRGPILRNDIENELVDVNLSFKSSAIGPDGGYASTFLPDGLETPRHISYMDGLVMSSGQNKGKILKAILKKTDAKFKVIVFFDDTLSNIENVEKELKDETDLYTFYYTHEEGRVKDFEKNKSKARKEWRQLQPVLKSVFGEI